VNVLGFICLDARLSGLEEKLIRTCIFKQNREQEEEEDNAKHS
jgi:hypothetical protein